MNDREDFSHHLNQQALAELAAGRPADAVMILERALDRSPECVDLHAHLAVAHARAGSMAEAVAACEQALLLHRNQPRWWRPAHERELAVLSLVLEQRQHRHADHDAAYEQHGSAGTRYTVLLGCYGDFPQYSVRALDSIAAGQDRPLFCDVNVGLNACCRETSDRARALADQGVISGLIESSRNLNKDPIMRLLLEQARTPYILWLDDDSHFVDANWPATVAGFLAAEHPFDVAGQLARWGPRRELDPAYLSLVRARPWWRTIDHQPADLREWLPFVVGGMFLARTAFLRIHDYPDRGMVKALDDVLLGELVQQVGGRMIGMPERLLAMARISDGQRRGEDYLLNPGGHY